MEFLLVPAIILTSAACVYLYAVWMIEKDARKALESDLAQAAERANSLDRHLQDQARSNCRCAKEVDVAGTAIAKIEFAMEQFRTEMAEIDKSGDG